METTLGQVEIPGFTTTYQRQQELYPAREPTWQPVHTVYVPAHQLTPATINTWAKTALRNLADWHRIRGRDPQSALPEKIVVRMASPRHRTYGHSVPALVRQKLTTEPIEDLRIDFEDGYGIRSTEDEDTERAANTVAAWHASGALPRRWGIRVKSFADGHADRSIRTLDGFLTGVIRAAGELPPGFVVTFPKVLMVDYLRQFADRLSDLEEDLDLPHLSLGFEMQVEAPQTLLFLSEAVTASGGRLRAAHFGVFDYTAAIGLPPHEQRLDHPACDHARHLMQTHLRARGIELSDGSLAAAPASDADEDVVALLDRHAETVRHSLRHGFYQGWDMHPSHLVSRYMTVYEFHLRHYEEYEARVRAWEEQRQEGGIMDEPATIKTLTAALQRADFALGIGS
ncbi:DUF6986 family protein [Acrocarpospora catenulata]|uniref:DUF6986 family protein n=1 Tax=Acrocarpospora catenulata TaxID=2836182 RepID=UPI001BD99F5E|nr:aldolase [Acrocarpospora catenulata]